MRNYLESCLRGYVLLSIKSEKAQRFFHLCGFHGLVLWNIDCVSDQYQAYLSVPDLRNLLPICRKTHTKLHILEKHGLPFFFYKNRIMHIRNNKNNQLQDFLQKTIKMMNKL